MNPQHTIPTLNDNGFCLWESRAISAYLVDKYAKTDSLYPKDPAKRAIVDQRLYFDMGTLTQRFGDYFYPMVMHKKPADPEKKQKCEEALAFLNVFLDGHKYAAGETVTIADITLVATVSTYELLDFDISKYENVNNWYARCKQTVPGYQINVAGIEMFKKWLDDHKQKSN